jgi:hypothetical protein
MPGHGAGSRSNDTTMTYSSFFGPELGFGLRLQELAPHANIAIIKHARGGTGIHEDAAGSSGAWEPNYRGGSGLGEDVNQYDHFLATVRNAMSVDDIDGDGERDTLVPAGIVWMQVENDAMYGEAIALEYQADLKRLIDLMRAAFLVDDLPVAIGRISDSGQDADGVV